MSEKSENRSSVRITYKGVGMTIGLILGGLIGLVIGNLVIFAGGGMVVGFAIGAALD